MKPPPRVFVTQVPHRKDPFTSTLIPARDLSGVQEHGEMIVLVPPGATYLITRDLLPLLTSKLAGYDVGRGDCLLTLGDPVVAACATAILARRGAFTVLKWHKLMGRYSAVRVDE